MWDNFLHKEITVPVGGIRTWYFLILKPSPYLKATAPQILMQSMTARGQLIKSFPFVNKEGKKRSIYTRIA